MATGTSVGEIPAGAALTNAANETRDRIKAILNSEDAKGREALAQHFAFETDTTVDAALAALKVSPIASATKESRVQSYTERRLNAAGLAQPAYVPSPRLGGDLVASMKRRHGVE